MNALRSTLVSTPRWLRCTTGALLTAAWLTLAPTVAQAETLSVRVPTANFRSGPSTEHPILFSADRFYPVEVVEKKDKWVRIRDFEGDTAWVANWLLDDVRSVVISRGVVNVRDKASTKAPIVHTAERGAVFKVLGQEGSWLRVGDEEGEIGWIHKNLVWGLQDPPKPKPAAKPKKQASKQKKQASEPKEQADQTGKPPSKPKKGTGKPKQQAGKPNRQRKAG